jgi:DNA polymerase III sliding clamp (beta) subunit (PCNA family)
MTDLDISAVFSLPAKVEAPGVMLVQADKLADIAKKGSPTTKEITITQGPALTPAQIVCGDDNFKLPVTDPIMFPALPVATAGTHRVPVSTFNFLLDRAMFAAARSEKYKGLTDAVRIEREDGHLVGVGTDTKRLAIARRLTPGDDGFPPITVPKTAAESLFKLTKKITAEGVETDSEGDVLIADEPAALSFTIGDLHVFCRKQALEFPTWRTVSSRIDLNEYVEVRMLPTTLKDKIGRIIIIRGDAVIFEAAGERLDLRERSTEGEANTFLKCQVVGSTERVGTALDAKQVNDFLDAAIRGTERVSDVSMFVPKQPGWPVLFRYDYGLGRIDYIQSPFKVD